VVLAASAKVTAPDFAGTCHVVEVSPSSIFAAP
jgi:hypothetical protein